MKIFVVTKKQIMLCLVMAVVLTFTCVGAGVTMANSDRKLPIYCVETDKKQVAISFDAAWGNSKKVQIIRLL